MTDISREHRWTTDDEIAFIANLGRHATQLNGAELPAACNERDALLLRYLLTAKNRADWGEIDKECVLDFVGMERERIERTKKAYEGRYRTVLLKYTDVEDPTEPQEETQ